MEGSIRHSPLPSVLNMAPSNQVILKADAPRPVVGYFDIPKLDSVSRIWAPFDLISGQTGFLFVTAAVAPVDPPILSRL